MKGNKRKDVDGYIWEEDLGESTRYPNGELNVLRLIGPFGRKGYVRYNEEGNVIAGNVFLVS